MNSFNPKLLKSMTLPLGTTWLLGACMEAKGKQQFWEQKKPEILSALKNRAMVQSVESSNRIEGVEVDRQRLEPLILGNMKPVSRPEEEIMGYRHALEWVHSKHNSIEIAPKSILRLHELAQEGAGDAGQWKRRNNEIIEFDLRGERSVRFIPVEAERTEHFVNQLCLAYRSEVKNSHLPILIFSALFILDFLCIHPLRDGNGRVSRLLSLLLLYQQNIYVGKYISLERIVENNKDEYYEVLKQSSQGWHECRHNPMPWINFFLSTLRFAYKELAEKVEFNSTQTTGKGEMIEQIVLSQSSAFTLRDIQLQCPAVSLQMIKKILNDLKNEKKIELVGRGRGARWKLSAGRVC